MAVMHITEFDTTGKDGKGATNQVGATPALTHQRKVFTSSTQSDTFSPQTNLIRIITDADAYVLFGSNPTADATHMLIKASVPEYFGVRPGDKLAAYDGVT